MYRHSCDSRGRDAGGADDQRQQSGGTLQENPLATDDTDLAVIPEQEACSAWLGTAGKSEAVGGDGEGGNAGRHTFGRFIIPPDARITKWDSFASQGGRKWWDDLRA